MTIETNITNRRELASVLAQYMNTRAVYLGLPTFAYQIGDIRLSREGILSGNDLDGIFPFLEMQGIVAAQPKLIQEPVADQNLRIAVFVLFSAFSAKVPFHLFILQARICCYLSICLAFSF